MNECNIYDNTCTIRPSVCYSASCGSLDVVNQSGTRDCPSCKLNLLHVRFFTRNNVVELFSGFDSTA